MGEARRVKKKETRRDSDGGEKRPKYSAESDRGREGKQEVDSTAEKRPAYVHDAHKRDRWTKRSFPRTTFSKCATGRKERETSKPDSDWTK